MIFKATEGKEGKLRLGTNSSNVTDFFKPQKTLSDSDINTIKDYNAQINAGVTSQTAFNRTMLNASEGAQTLVANANGAAVSIKILTKSSKAAALGMNILAAAGNMIAFMVITQAIQFIVKGIDNLINASTKCKERVDDLMSSFNTALAAANSNAKKVEEMASQYESLSKGVNNLGENVSLTADEYKEYNSIVNDIADMFPQMVQGYTSEGNAILSLKGNVELLRDAYKGAQQEAYNMLIATGKNSDGNDIIKQFKNLSGPTILGLKTHDIGVLAKQEIAKLIQNSDGDIDDLYTQINQLIREKHYNPEDVFSFFKEEFGIDRITPKNISDIRTQAKIMAQTYEAEIQSALSDVHSLADAFLNTNEDYAKLDEQSKKAVSIIVNSLDANIVSGFKDEYDVGNYVDGIVQAILTNPNAKDAMVGLFTMDTSRMPIEDIKHWTDKYLETIGRILGKDPAELKVMLKFDDVDALEAKYQNVIQSAKDKFGGEDLTSFFTDNSINTEDEIDKWIRISRSCDTAAEAKKKYLEEGVDVSGSFTLTGEQSKAIDHYQSNIQTLAYALDSLKSTGSVDMTDLIQEFPELENESGSLNDALKKLIDDALTGILSFLGENAPDNLKTSLEELADSAKGVAIPLQAAFSAIQTSHDVFESFKKELSTGLTETTLSSIAGLSGALNDLVSGFHAGVVTADELYAALSSHYETDLKNYSNALTVKHKNDVAFANAVGLNSSEVTNQFSIDYGIDLENHKTYAAKKEEIERQTLQTIGNMWTDFYDAQNMTLTKAGQELEDTVLNGYAVNDPATIALYNSLHKQSKIYEDAVNSLDKITYESISSNFTKFTTSMGGSDTGSSDSSSTGSGSSDSGSGITDSEALPKEEQKKEYDWTERAIDSINKKRAQSQALIDNETQSYQNQISALQELVSLDDQLIQVSGDALSTYTARWEQIKNDLISVLGESEGKAVAAKIEHGDASLAGSKSEYDSEQSEVVDRAITIYDAMTKADDDYATAVQERTQHIKAEFDKRLEQIKAYSGEVSNALSQAQSRIDLKDTTGREVTEADYKHLISLSGEQVRLSYDQIDALEDQLSQLDEVTPEYYAIQSSIADCEASIADAKKAQAQWNEEIKNLPIRKIQRYLDLLKYVKQDLNNYMAEQASTGTPAHKDQYQQLIDISKKQIDKLLKEQDLIRDKLGDYTFNSDKYKETASDLQDIDNEISDLIQSQNEWNKAILQLPADQLTKVNDTLNSTVSAMGEVLSDYDKAIAAVTDAIDRESESIKDLSDAAKQSYQDKIDPLQDELDLLQKQNKERELQLGLEQAQYHLDRAGSQRNVTAIRDGEQVYISDIDDVRAAQKELKEAEYNKVVDDLSSQIELLEKERDAILKGYDEQITKLDEIKDRWSSIKQDAQAAADALTADSILGEGWKDKLLSGDDTEMLNSIKDLYSTISSQKNQYEEQIASNERVAQMMNQFMEQWLNGSITYDQAMAGIQNLATQMADGFTGLEHLDALVGLNGFGDLSSMLEGMKESANASVSQFADYMEIVKANSDAISQYTSSWEEMQQNIRDQIAALEKLAEEAAKAAERIKNNVSGGGGSKNNISHGTIYADGNTTITNQHVEGFYTGGANPGGGNSDPGYVDSGPGVEKHHDGLKGFSAKSDSDARLKLLGIRKLDTDEFFSLVKRGEHIITPEQQKNLADNLNTAWSFTPTLPSYSSSVLNRPETPAIACQIGDINVTGVQDPDGFAKALAKEIGPTMQQSMSKIFRK